MSTKLLKIRSKLLNNYWATVFKDDKLLQVCEEIEAIEHFKNNVFDKVESHYVFMAAQIQEHFWRLRKSLRLFNSS